MTTFRGKEKLSGHIYLKNLSQKTNLVKEWPTNHLYIINRIYFTDISTRSYYM